MLSLSHPVATLHLLNPAHEKALAKLGIKSIGDLLYHFPRDWQDLSDIKPVAEIRPGEKINIRAFVKQVSNPGFPFRRVKITEALLEDQTGNVVAVWFNHPYIKNSLKVGREYYFSGKGQIYSAKKQTTLQLQHPTFEQVKENTIHVAGIIPIYQLTEGVSQKQIRYWLKQCLEALESDIDKTDFLPQTIRTRLKLVDINSALHSIHFPEDNTAIEHARRRLAFEELFLFQLAFQSYKKTLKSLPAPAIPLNTEQVTKFVSKLPFNLTNSQRLAAWEILRDISVAHPMNRLLEGEVGSGKTVVAGLAMYETAHAGYQSVLLAPTEILALQHYETLKQLFSHTSIEVALLTRSHKITPSQSPPHEGERKEEVIIGTHALLQEGVKFQNIGLLVVDEQHRFGVKQRAHLTKNRSALVPHLLSMTATPIPRTLALAFYGDLDISQLKELPTGRKKVITRLVSAENRTVAYEFIRKELARGRQAYVIVPLVDGSNPSPPPLSLRGEVSPLNLRGGEGELLVEKKSVLSEAEKLQKIFPEFQIASLHGRMSGEEKKQIMEDYKSNKTQILVSTTVVEVGVDVPNATIMIIENAERFGLATLHQLRGRVGRGKLQSLCILFAETNSESTKERLEAVVNSTDGFLLAEIDLKLRGAGEILGSRQSGYIPFKIAKLSDTKTIDLAKAEALALLEADPQLTQFPKLAEKVAAISRDAHLE